MSKGFQRRDTRHKSGKVLGPSRLQFPDETAGEEGRGFSDAMFVEGERPRPHPRRGVSLFTPERRKSRRLTEGLPGSIVTFQ